MAAFTEGDLVRVSVLFLVDDSPLDPNVVTLRYKNPAGTITVWVYLTDAQVVRDSVGLFRADINANAGGVWSFRWEGTGPAQGAGQDTFTVTATNI